MSKERFTVQLEQPMVGVRIISLEVEAKNIHAARRQALARARGDAPNQEADEWYHAKEYVEPRGRVVVAEITKDSS